MIKTIFLDLDNTILDFDKAERNAITKTLLDLDIEPKESILKRYSEINLSQWELLEKGLLTRDELRVRRYRLLFDELGIKCSPEEAAHKYEHYLGIGHYFLEGAEDMLKSLSKNYDLYLATNGSENVQKGRIESANITKYFKDMFISSLIGYNKPSKEYFDTCFAKISDFKKEEAVMIGDRLMSDILGGKNAGIKTIWFNPNHKKNTLNIIPDYEVHSFNEIYDILNIL